MRLDLEQAEATAFEGLGGTMRQPAGERGLAGPRRADKQDHAVQRNDAAVNLSSAW